MTTADNNFSAPNSASPASATADDAAAVQPVISDQTGQFDARFALWREFCTQTGIDVETLPSELTGELKERWESMKDNQLTPLREEVTNTPVTTQS